MTYNRLTLLYKQASMKFLHPMQELTEKEPDLEDKSALISKSIRRLCLRKVRRGGSA